MSFKIIKKAPRYFEHVYNGGSKSVDISDFEAVLESISQTFSIQCKNGSNIPLSPVSVLDIIVIDETDASVEETFTDVEVLRARLTELQYIPYISPTGIEEAPIDGQSYARKDGAWIAVTGLTTPTLQEVTLQGDRPTIVISDTDYVFVATDRAKYLVSQGETATLNAGVFVGSTQLFWRNFSDADQTILAGTDVFFYVDDFIAPLGTLTIPSGYLVSLKKAPVDADESWFVNMQSPKALESSTTNLGYTASPTDGTITNDNGDDATLPLADDTNAGLLKPADFTQLSTLATDLSNKVTKNTAITGATKTKVTYDSKGLVTSGADATTADIADSTNKRYVTDAQQTVLGNTSNTNSGDETASSIGAIVNGSSSATPNNTDLVATVESSVVKKITWTNVKAFLKTYFDTVYEPIFSKNTAFNKNFGTGTTNIPEIGSTLTASRALVTDSNGKLAPSTTTSTQIGYADFTSSGQTQLNNKWYNMSFGALQVASPADATSYYFSQTIQSPASVTAASRAFKFGFTGTIKSGYLQVNQSSNGSNEDVTLYIRNLTTSTDYLIGTWKSDFGSNTGSGFYYSGLSISLSATDDYVIKILTPTWTSNPTVQFYNVTLSILQ